MYLLKMSGLQIWLCLFTFRPIASKQLNSLITIDSLRWLCGEVVTHPLWVQEVPGWIPSSGKGFYVYLFCFVVVVFLLLVQKHIISHNSLQFLYTVNLFSIFNILQDLWPFLRVQRYRPSIFNTLLYNSNCIWISACILHYNMEEYLAVCNCIHMYSYS